MAVCKILANVSGGKIPGDQNGFIPNKILLHGVVAGWPNLTLALWLAAGVAQHPGFCFLFTNRTIILLAFDAAYGSIFHNLRKRKCNDGSPHFNQNDYDEPH